MARQLSEISTKDLGEGKRQITIETQFPTRNFTLRVGAKCQRVQVDGVDLREVYAQRDLTEGTFWAENKSTTIVIDLPMGGRSIEVKAK